MFEQFKKNFMIGWNSDKCRESSTRKLVRYVSKEDHIGNLDAMRKIVSIKQEVPEDVRNEALKWMEEG